MKISLTVNGKDHELEVPPNRRLLDLIRDDLHLKGAKEGCSQGECGACTVVLNDQAVCSCLILVSQLPPNSVITTIESHEPLIHKIKQAFVDAGAIQCGFCTPGMILSAYVLFQQNPRATVDEIKAAISGNLCRCTGYTKIINALLLCQTRSLKE